MLAGQRNPHTSLRRNGAFQLLLVLFGAWPLVLPGAAGLGWALWDAWRILQADLVPAPAKDAPSAEASPEQASLPK